MRLKEIDPDEMNISSQRTKQKRVREMLDQFQQSNMKCAEIENWEEISDTLDSFRCLVKNQISYRNGSKYKNIKLVTNTSNGYKVYLLKKEDN